MFSKEKLPETKPNQTEVKTTLIKRNCINGQARVKDVTK